MNDYIAKPVDEKLLHHKIVSTYRASVYPGKLETMPTNMMDSEEIKYTDLRYLSHRTKSNPDLMMEMIGLYLNQTPLLVQEMKQNLLQREWKSLHATVHKLIPSFNIMGIPAEFESIAKKVQEYAGAQLQTEIIEGLVEQLETVCNAACKELETAFNRIKNTNH
jgi:HPt (histidine-containing phosphotransfer) domain-containing protein